MLVLDLFITIITTAEHCWTLVSPSITTSSGSGLAASCRFLQHSPTLRGLPMPLRLFSLPSSVLRAMCPNSLSYVGYLPSTNILIFESIGYTAYVGPSNEVITINTQCSDFYPETLCYEIREVFYVHSSVNQFQRLTHFSKLNLCIILS